MSLIVDLQVTANVGMLRAGELVITRLEALEDRDAPDDEVHPYRVREGRRGESREAFFVHRYGDGAMVCLARALRALGYVDQYK